MCIRDSLISALVEEQIMDNTVILFVSDHGEMLGDHLMFQKAKPVSYTHLDVYKRQVQT